MGSTRLSTCLCCIPIRAGVIAIAFLNLLVDLQTFYTDLVALGLGGGRVSYQFHAPTWVTGIDIAISSLGLLFTFAGLIGAIKGHSRGVRAYSSWLYLWVFLRLLVTISVLVFLVVNRGHLSDVCDVIVKDLSNVERFDCNFGLKISSIAVWMILRLIMGLYFATVVRDYARNLYLDEIGVYKGSGFSTVDSQSSLGQGPPQPPSHPGYQQAYEPAYKY